MLDIPISNWFLNTCRWIQIDRETDRNHLFAVGQRHMHNVSDLPYIDITPFFHLRRLSIMFHSLFRHRQSETYVTIRNSQKKDRFKRKTL